MIVVDSAAVVDALVGPVGETDGLRRRLSGEQLHAPALLDFELVSALRGLTRGGRLSAHRAADALGDFDDLPIERWPLPAPLRRRALQLRENLSAYDAAYVSLAEALDCPLITRDARLARCGGHAAAVEVL